jgi:uncharacterized protein (DUF4213/DUF364 family)
MKIIKDVISTLNDAKVIDVRIGLHWTAVIVERMGIQMCGLASTVNNEHHAEGVPDVEMAGNLSSLSALELANYALSPSNIQTSIGIAAINALIQPQPDRWKEVNAEYVIAKHGENKNVAIIGSFPFVKRIENNVNRLCVFDLHPAPGEYKPEQAPDILPTMDLVAITGMTLVNKTLDQLLPHIRPDAVKIMLGPSTFMSDVMFDYGFQLLSGAYVETIAPAVQTMCEGGTFKQVHQAGVRLLTMASPSFLNPA